MLRTQIIPSPIASRASLLKNGLAEGVRTDSAGMSSQEELTSFIRSTFRSIWSLELLLFLVGQRERCWSRSELVTALRASDLIVAQSLEALVAAGLLSIDEAGCARYSPAAADLERLTERTRELYGRSPDAVRRMIISSATGGLAAFADAFRLRKD
jgi:hypothetical protein